MPGFSGLVAAFSIHGAVGITLTTWHAVASRWDCLGPVYYPKLLRRRDRPPYNGALWWLWRSLHASEEDVLHHAGLDAAIYLCLLQLACKVFGTCSLTGLLVLLPVYATGGNLKDLESSNPQFVYDSMDLLSMANLPQGSPRLWASFLSAWLVSLVTFYHLHCTYEHVSRLRASGLAGEGPGSQGPRPDQLALLITDIPAPGTEASVGDEAGDEAAVIYEVIGGSTGPSQEVEDGLTWGHKMGHRLAAVQKLGHPLAGVRASAGRESGQEVGDGVVLGDAWEAYVDSHFRRLLGDLYLGCTLVRDAGGARRLFDVVNTTRRRLQRAEGKKEMRRSRGEGVYQPHHRRWCCGLCGPATLSVPYYSKRLITAQQALAAEQARVEAYEPASAAFIFLTSPAAAALAANGMFSRTGSCWQPHRPPEPRDVLWDNIRRRWQRRWVMSWVAGGIVALIVLFYMIPIGFIAAFMSVDTIVHYLPPTKPILTSPVVRGILEGILPTLAMVIFLSLLPAICSALSNLHCVSSSSSLAVSSAAKMFWFMFVNVFLGTTLASSIFSQVQALVANPPSIVRVLGASIPNTASFFITLVLLKSFSGYSIELSRIVSLVFYLMRKHIFAVTEVDRDRAWVPCPIRYDTQLPNQLLVFMLGLVFSTIAPLMYPFVLIYFTLGYVVMKHQLLTIYESGFEGYGKMWPLIHGRIIASTLIAQITLIGYLSLKYFKWSVLLFPLPVLTIVFDRLCKAKFQQPFISPSISLEGAQKTAGCGPQPQAAGSGPQPQTVGCGPQPQAANCGPQPQTGGCGAQGRAGPVLSLEECQRAYTPDWAVRDPSFVVPCKELATGAGLRKGRRRGRMRVDLSMVQWQNLSSHVFKF